MRIVELALEAPTGSNGQNWEFIAVTDPELSPQDPLVLGDC
jgi:nitroreductase